MKWLFIGILWVIISSCESDKHGYNKQTHEGFTLIDSCFPNGRLRTFANSLSNGIYPVFYIGNLKDSLILPSEPISASILYRKKNFKGLFWAIPDSSKMRIFVDTNFNLGCKIYYRHYSDLMQRLVLDSNTTYWAFPVFFQNKSDTILYLGMGNHLENLVLQAQNKQGVWMDIEKQKSYSCGTCLRDLYIDVDECLVSKFLPYKGNMISFCRLKYQNKTKIIYSNTFCSSIDSNFFCVKRN